ncbi:MAG: S8 family serine peptidase [Labilithrix sp.]|nr:S8 family serine peptidase [Labilithrix sp.]MBX3218286.1 S8 family serine peptidase [Labilithrix sp.]
MTTKTKPPANVRSVESTMRNTVSGLEAVLDTYRAAAGLAPVTASPALLAAVASPMTPARLRGELVARSREAKRPKYRSDQLLVTIDPSVAGSVRARAGRTASLVADPLGGPFAALEREGLIEDVTAVGAPRQARVGIAARGLRSLAASVDAGVDEELVGVNVVRLAPGAPLAEVVRRLDDVPAVREIERVPYRTIAPPSRPRPLAAARAARRARPWNYDAIGWESINPPNARALRVAVLDTGVDDGHPDLAIASYEHGEVTAEDIVGHGTHVCGIIAGKASRRGAFVGGVSNPALHVWKIFSDEPDPDTGEYYVDEILYQRALVAALRSGCRVLNLSIGGEGTTSRERALFRRLVSAGTVIVAAMGNEYEDGNPTEYPAAHPGVIAVGAVGRDLTRAPFSNTGSHIALVAPGVDILSTLPGQESDARAETEHAAWDGTSMATPHVAGAVARLLAVDPDLTPEQVKEELQRTAKPLPRMNGRSWTRLYGAGLLQI